MSAPKFTVHIRGTIVKIYINEILHLTFNRQLLLSVYSYIESYYTIELTFLKSKRRLKVEYDEMDKWTEVLRILNAHI